MKYTITLLIIGLFSLSAMARMPEARDQIERLSTILDLSEEQSTQIGTILTANHGKAMALMKQLTELKKQTDTEIKALLTAEQAEKFDTLQQRRERMGGPPAERF